MPHYHFNIHDGENQCLDLDGTELPDMNAVRAEAARDLYELAKEMLPIAGRRDFSLSVTDGAGTVILQEILSVTVERLKVASP